MSPDILVATPQAAVGELLRLSLEESRQYRVRMVQSGHEALAAASRIPFDLAILDATLSDQTVATLMRSLVGQRASLKLVVIPPENDPAKLEPNGLRPDATLNLPFYAPDLVELVNSLLQGAPTKEASKDIPIADQACDRFNKNPEEIKGALVAAIGPATAHTCLVICNRDLATSAGRLEVRRVQEIAAAVLRSWDAQSGGDLARYVRLAEGGGEVLVYATALSGGAILALVYDASASMTRVHRQAVKLAQALRALPDLEIVETQNLASQQTHPEQMIGAVDIPTVETQNIASQQTNPEQTAGTGNIPTAETHPVREIGAGDIASPAVHSDRDLGPVDVAAPAGEDLADLFGSSAPSSQAAADLLLALKQDSDAQSPATPAQSVETQNLASLPEDAETQHLASLPTGAEMQDIAPLPGGIETQHLASQPEGNETQNFTSLQETGLEEEGELPEISLSDLLAAMPSPDPGESKLEPGIEWITSDEEDGTAGDFLFPWEKAIPAAETPAEQAPAAVATPPEESVAISSEPLTSPDSPVEKTTPTEPEPAQATAITPAEGALASTPTQAIPDEAIAAGETQLNAVTAVPAATVALVAPSEPPPADDSTKKIIRTAPGATFPMVSSNMALTQRVATPWTQVPLPPPPPAPEPWNQADELESASGDFATLTYTCVMLPRLPDIKLSGRLVNKLAEKLQQICLAYGWRLVSQLIRPDTFQWTVQVAAIVSPGSVARVVRQQTSQFIFDQFDQFSDKLMSGDFWAPGYLIISGSQPPDTRLIGEYIRQTRKRQGIRL